MTLPLSLRSWVPRIKRQVLDLTLYQVVSEVFGLSYVVLSTEDQVSVDKFGEAILSDEPGEFLDSKEKKDLVCSWSA